VTALRWINQVVLDAVVARDAIALGDVNDAPLNAIPFGALRPLKIV
jgi:hypothetical protein